MAPRPPNGWTSTQSQGARGRRGGALVADELFAGAGYHAEPTAAERALGYLDLRDALVGDAAPAEHACLIGTMVQEAFATSPALGESILGHAATLKADLAEALADAGHEEIDPALVQDSIDHLRRYLRSLLLPGVAVA